MKFNSYADVVKYALDLSTSEEEEIIRKEDELFRSRGWEEYILFAVNFISYLDSNGFHLVYRKSIMDSFIVLKCLDYVTKYTQKENSKGVLYNDALRMYSLCRGFVEFRKEVMIAIDKYLEKELSNSNLFYKQEIISEPTSASSYDGEKLLVISKKELSRSEFEYILNESKDDNNTDILHNVFIIDLQFYPGI